MSGVFHQALAGAPLATPPIWLMRQAGRYHAHYQRLRARHSFDALCRTPELAADAAMGPIDDFDFDAAILFSDLLFPLEALGLGLSYAQGRPEVERLETAARLERFRPLAEATARLAFQRDALAATRARLPRDKGLIGFVGGPWTLFVYAAEGTHEGALALARSSLALYHALAAHLVPLLVEAVRLQFEGGADLVMVFDTAAGALAPGLFASAIVPDLAAIARAYPGRLGYYAKDVSADHLAAPAFAALPWAGVGLDPGRDLRAALTSPHRRGFVQGNFSPERLQLTGRALDAEIDAFLAPLAALPHDARRGWICGLGHGVKPGTPESSVRTFVQRVRERLA